VFQVSGDGGQRGATRQAAGTGTAAPHRSIGLIRRQPAVGSLII